MRKAVVAEIGFYDNQLTQKLVELEDNTTWKDAYLKAFVENSNDETIQWIKEMPDDLTEAKTWFFDGDMMIDVLFL